jgi:SecD/SecF fusion protein
MADKSITQTLSRSLFTSLTTFFMVLTLYIFGVSSIREFALPIGVGIVAGTYSSVCLSSSFWYLMRKQQAKKAAAVKASDKAAKAAKASGNTVKAVADKTVKAETAAKPEDTVKPSAPAAGSGAKQTAKNNGGKKKKKH